MNETEWLASNDPQAMLNWLRLAELEWATASDEARRRANLCTDRKLRLFAVACCRQVWHLLTDDVPCGRCNGRAWITHPESGMGTHCPGCSGTGRINRSRRAVEVAERYADGQAMGQELDKALDGAMTVWQENPISNPAGMARYAASVNLQNALQQITRPELYDAPTPAAQAALLRDIFGNPFQPWCTESDRRWADRDSADADEWVTRTCGNRILREAWFTWRDGLIPSMAQQIYDSRDFSLMGILADALEEAGCTDEGILLHCRLPGVHVRGCWAIDLILGKS